VTELTVAYRDDWLAIYGGDNRAVMATMPAESVHAVVTSPPYWGLRDYGLPPSVWGGDPLHEHEWGSGPEPRANRHQVQGATSMRQGRTNVAEQRSDNIRRTPSAFCACGAWRGALGLEPTPELYIDHLMDVLDGVWRVLRPEGTLWLNLGDTFWSTGGAGGTMSSSGTVRGAKGQVARPEAGDPEAFGRWNRRNDLGIKSKDLVGIPWMAAFAARARGWYLRRDVVWAKPNSMPESVEDRPTSSHEYLFMLTKEPVYYFDWFGVREQGTSGPSDIRKMIEKRDRITKPETQDGNPYANHNALGQKRGVGDPTARMIRSVWSIATQAYPGAHYAVFPKKLVEPCVKASTSERGVCADCGAPWERVVRRSVDGRPEKGGSKFEDEEMRGRTKLVGGGADWYEYAGNVQHMGWMPTCDHVEGLDEWPSLPKREKTEEAADWDARCEPVWAVRMPLLQRWNAVRTVPATVLDPFAGTGTTALVAQQHSRRGVLIDLNAEYLAQQMERNDKVPLGL
jgi:DNA modification methylase